MKTRIAPGSSLLIDADAMIEAFALGVRDLLAERLKVVMGDTARQEAHHWRDKWGVAHPLDLHILISEGKLTVEKASLSELDMLKSRLPEGFSRRLDPGETEELSMLYSGRFPRAHFCSGDGRAIEALKILQLLDWGVSLEGALHDLDIRFSQRLRRQFTEAAFEAIIR